MFLSFEGQFLFFNVYVFCVVSCDCISLDAYIVPPSQPDVLFH